MQYQNSKGEEIKEADFTETKRCSECNRIKPLYVFGDVICKKCEKRLNPPTEKVCSACHLSLPIENFYTCGSENRHSICKVCKARRVLRPVPCYKREKGMTYAEIMKKQMAQDPQFKDVIDTYYRIGKEGDVLKTVMDFKK
jgi:hypothetical protein